MSANVNGLRLADLADCFEGVVPALVATADADGRPNLSYLSQVVRVGDEHVALSNQFFGKTAANLRQNPRAALLLVDGRTGQQYRLRAVWLRTESDGSLFERVDAQLRAGITQTGMAKVMRLRGVDIYRVERIDRVPAPPPEEAIAAPPPASLEAVAALAGAIAAAEEVEDLLDALLDGLSARFPRTGILVLAHDEHRGVLATVASHGFPAAGIGSEVAPGSGTIGVAAADRRPVRITDMSRVRRMTAAVRASGPAGDDVRQIPLPGLPGSLSQIAMPLLAQGRLHGVLYAESDRRMAFDAADEALFRIVAGQTANALAALEAPPREPAPAPGPADAASRNRPGAPDTEIRIVHHRYDDSVFIDNGYVIKGLPGRLLVCMLELHLREGRTEFSNRELRLVEALKLPPLKDNLETRLLLLRRRLDEKRLPVTLHRIGRGRLRLDLRGRPVIEQP
ncbi:GAF domain-containing protein [Marinibaculum pumilum]|uniref:GAF domain-containing protein n=1 Tax=Marinibaculum pumilum TaxID=1766165 RepID=A0ABV7KTN2_9PROT